MFDDLIKDKENPFDKIMEEHNKSAESLRCKGFTNLIHVSTEDMLNCPFCNDNQKSKPVIPVTTSGTAGTSGPGDCGCGSHDSGQTGPCGSPNKSAGTP